MTIEQQPTGYNAYGCNDELVYVVSDSLNVDEPKYRYIAQVFINGTSVAKLKALPNSSNSGVFNIAYIVRDYLEPAQDFNTTNYANDLDGTKSVQVKFGYEYAASESEVPSETLNEEQSGTIVVTSGTYQRWVSDYGVLFVNNFDVTQPNGPVLSKYTDAGIGEAKVTEDDWGTLSVFRPDTASAYDIGIRFFDEDGGQIADGNGYLYGEVIATGNALTGSGVAQLGVYPANLRNNTNPLTPRSVNPDDYTGWVKYELFHLTPSGAILFTFVREDACYERTRFAWWNSLGTWEFMNFYGREKAEESVERKSYRTYGGNAFTAGSEYIRTAQSGLVSGGRSKVKRSVTINSNWVTEAMNEVVRDLFHAPVVFVQEGDVWLPVMIRGNSIRLNRRLTDGAFEYTFTFEYVNPISHVG